MYFLVLQIVMKKSFLSLAVATMIALGFTGCAISPVGWLYTDATTPAVDLEVASDMNAKATKVGKSTCTNILGLVMTGDCGIDAAMRSGGINKVQSVDMEIMNILGIIYKTTTVVRGE